MVRANKALIRPHFEYCVQLKLQLLNPIAAHEKWGTVFMELELRASRGSLPV